MEYCPIKMLEMYVLKDGDRPQDYIDRVVDKVGLCRPTEVYSLAVRIREEKGNVITPFVLAYAMVQYKMHKNIADLLLVDIIKTVDDVLTFISIYRKGKGKTKFASTVKRGISKSLSNTNLLAYPDREVSRWLLRMFHPKPMDEAQSNSWKRVLEEDIVRSNG